MISVQLKILRKKDEPLLSRTRIESEIVFDKATPSGQEVKSSLAKALSKDEKLLDVLGIYTQFGLKKAKILCYAYENEEVLKRIKIEKKTIEKKAKTEEKPEEVKKEEPKKEEKAEAKKKETKKEEKVEAKQEKKEGKQETKEHKQEKK